MDSRDFQDLATDIVVTVYNDKKLSSIPIRPEGIFTVWMAKALNNSKAVLATERDDDYLFEVTYNGAMNECYLDIYEKRENVVIHGDD